MPELIEPCAKCGDKWAGVIHANGNGNSYWVIICGSTDCLMESPAKDSFEEAVSAWNRKQSELVKSSNALSRA